jgi:hypothetical protein
MSGPLGLGLDADGIGNPVDVVEVRDHLNGVVDRRVGPSSAAERFDLRLVQGGRLVRQRDREVTESANARLEFRLPVVVRRMLGELVVCALGTEVVGMRTNSVVAVVRARDDNGEELPLRAGELGRAEHDRFVEAHRSPEHPRVERHRLDDVEHLARAADGGVVLAPELSGRLVLVDQAEVRHGAILPQCSPKVAKALSEWNKLRPCGATEGDRVGSPEDTMSEFDAEQLEETPAHGSAGVGARVTSILEAAEQAAEQIRSDALREAAETMKRAEADADARIQELTREAERVRAEADDYARDIRQAVDSYGTQARREAEEEARALMQSAEDQSRSIRESAEAMAEQIQGEAHRRHEHLQSDARALEERRQRVLEGLRDLAAQLQDALVEPVRSQEDSLVDALEVERRR